jgi:hypothetical protein
VPGVGLECRPDYSGLLRNLSVSYVTRFARSYFPTRENSRFPDPFPVRVAFFLDFSYFLIFCFCIVLCPGWDSNPQALVRAKDFKSFAYTNSATRALIINIIYFEINFKFLNHNPNNTNLYEFTNNTNENKNSPRPFVKMRFEFIKNKFLCN